MNKKIASEIAIGIIVLVAIGFGAAIYFGGKSKKAETPAIPIDSPKTEIPVNPVEDGGNQIACPQDAKQCPDGSYVSRTAPNCEFAECPEKSSVNWESVQFDDCGGKEKYEKLEWWKDFISKVETFKVMDEYLSVDNFNEYGEGCLTIDGSGFIAVFPGEYAGIGNYVFRYSILDSLLEKAKKISEDDYGESAVWFAPPLRFSKRTGNIIKMTGESGDAGCSVDTEFNYDFVNNEIKKIKQCSECIGEEARCEVF